jgi:signal peptidase
MKAKKTKRWAGAFTSIAIFFLIAPAVASSYFSINIFTVTSQSMKPYISAGDEIVTTVVLARDVKVGNIIIIASPNNIEKVSHRVVSITTTDNLSYTISTKGDANPIVDSPTQTYSAGTSIRKVVTVVPKVGYLLSSVSSTATKIFASIGFIVYLVSIYRRAGRKLVTANLSVSNTEENPQQQIAEVKDAEIGEKL